ncbi:hypothetical protein GCM10008957_23310 [Deinococcus ruber]|uniref:Uncharacterized protein n=1 Tax=Deinococcus ruber TaxID=1848197 RepID=A0A918F8A9_9DEIO|nr:hypothetical protein GCM10008957_23310 [Deinococcus ruber]
MERPSLTGHLQGVPATHQMKMIARHVDVEGSAWEKTWEGDSCLLTLLIQDVTRGCECIEDETLVSVVPGGAGRRRKIHGQSIESGIAVL